MKIITVINAKGGCGKSTIAVGLADALSRGGHRALLVDMDPQAQATQWLLGAEATVPSPLTLDAAIRGEVALVDTIQNTAFPRLSIIAASRALEDAGRLIEHDEDHPRVLADLLASLEAHSFDFVVIDSPNQISPVMRNAIHAADFFIVPFESAKAVNSYAEIYALQRALRPDMSYQTLHVLNNLSRHPGLRELVIRMLDADGIELADTEIRSCGWLARVDQFGGSIFNYRPKSNGAADMETLRMELIKRLRRESGAGVRARAL
jgi:chromosome partitioning protein